MADRHLQVFVRLDGDDIRVGDLWSHRRRGTESATFAYTADFLVRPDAYELEPALPLHQGPQQTAAGQALFGAFADSAPDRWGRTLVDRRGREAAGEGERSERSLGEIDYLLGARDDMRQGALRYCDAGGGPFLADEAVGVPTLTGLGDLLAASERVERDEEVAADLELLLNGGSSLGGARPKAHVVDAEGRPAIAKFPSPSVDDWDVMRWEAVALDLARAAAIAVPPSQLIEVAGKPVLVVERFDREDGERIGYVSAMTMLERGDGEDSSYLEFAEAVEERSPRTGVDLAELWRRIAFSILISNTDDHLRNHGFLRRSTAGWSLAPAFDLNPNPQRGATALRTAIDFDRHEARVETLLEVAPLFRLEAEQARAILGEVASATGDWRRVAGARGISRRQQDAMAPAFERQLDTARDSAAA
jgi:serine/threonine-protein kinase HipA